MQLKIILENILRYALGIIMMAYGFIKIFEIQFLLPSEVFNLELNAIDGVTLTWVFLGFSPWFSILLGTMEFLPALLLLFNRTKLIGIVFLLPSLVVVFLVNNAYGFLLHMRFLKWSGGSF